MKILWKNDIGRIHEGHQRQMRLARQSKNRIARLDSKQWKHNKPERM